MESMSATENLTKNPGIVKLWILEENQEVLPLNQYNSGLVLSIYPYVHSKYGSHHS